MPHSGRAGGAWARALDLARETPPERNRYVDFLRAVSILVVVLGHWLMAAPRVTADGASLGHMLDLAPWTRWLTWALKVMPTFFLVGGVTGSGCTPSVVEVPAGPGHAVRPPARDSEQSRVAEGADGLTIVSPAPGTIVTSGATITVVVEPDAGLTVDEVLVVGQDAAAGSSPTVCPAGLRPVR